MKRYWYLHYDKLGRSCDGYITANNKQEACDKLNSAEFDATEGKRDYKPSDLRVAKWK